MRKYDDKEILDALESTAAYEFASLKAARSGLPADIWLDEAGQDRELPHNLARSKVRINGQFIPFSLEKEPKYLVSLNSLKASERKIAMLMLQFVKENIDVFMAHWENQIDTFEAFETLIDRAHSFMANH